MVIVYLAAVILSIALYGTMGAVSLARNRASSLNRLHFAMAIALALWSSAFIVHQLSDGSSFPMYRITAGLSLAFFSLLCHSSVIPLSGGWKRAGPAAIYLCCFFSLVGTALIPEHAGDFYLNHGFWSHTAPLASPLFIIQNVYCIAAGSVGVGVPLFRELKAKESRDSKGAALRLAGLGTCLAVFYANQVALPLAGVKATPYFPPLIFTVCALGILYSRFTHGFLSADAANATQERMPPFPEYSVLVDAEGMILEVDEQAQAMLGRTAEDLKGKRLGAMIVQPESVQKEIQRMGATNSGQSSCLVAWITQRGKPCQGRSRISAVRNAFGRVTGYLITPFALGEIGALKDEYSLTDREIEVIHFAAQGQPNQMIARELSITERTVKAHLTNIYNKMGIDGKFKLMNRLKDFDI